MKKSKFLCSLASVLVNSVPKIDFSGVVFLPSGPAGGRSQRKVCCGVARFELRGGVHHGSSNWTKKEARVTTGASAIHQSINQSNRWLQVIQSTNQSITYYWFVLIVLIKQSINQQDYQSRDILGTLNQSIKLKTKFICQKNATRFIPAKFHGCLFFPIKKHPFENHAPSPAGMEDFCSTRYATKSEGKRKIRLLTFHPWCSWWSFAQTWIPRRRRSSGRTGKACRRNDRRGRPHPGCAKLLNSKVRTRQSPWVETGAFLWRVGGRKFCLRFSVPYGLPLLQLRYRSKSGLCQIKWRQQLYPAITWDN